MRSDNKVCELACHGSSRQTPEYGLMMLAYQHLLKRLHEKVREKQPTLFANNQWILHHDSARAHMPLPVSEFLASKQITVLEHPTCSPELVPNNFLLFLKLKEILKGRNFDDIHDITNITMAALKAIPQNQSQNCLGGWTKS
jgi:hypothetical protein